jgi:hypothetical protein
MADPYIRFAQALEKARQTPGASVYITIEGDEIDDGDPEVLIPIRPEYRVPATRVHVDLVKPDGVLRYVNVEQGRVLNVRDAPAISGKILRKLDRGVPLLVDLATAMQPDDQGNVWVQALEINGGEVKTPQYVALGLLSETDPKA